MNWGTMYATIRRRCRKTAADDVDIKVAICDAIALHRRERLRWNQARMSLTLAVNTSVYGPSEGLPADLVAIIGRTIFLDWSGDVNQRTPLMWVPRERIDMYQAGTIISGAPSWWSFWDERLVVYPPSDNSTNVLRAPYIADVGSPTYSCTNAQPPVYTFLQQDGTTAVGDSYTSPWFDQSKGFNIIAWKAEWDLWTSVWQASAGQDQNAAVKYADALQGAQDVTDLQTAGRQVQPYIPYYPGRF